MAPFSTVSFLLLLFVPTPIAAGDQLDEAVRMAKSGIWEGRSRVLQSLVNVHGSGKESDQSPVGRQAMEDCGNLYGATHARLDRIVLGEVHDKYDDGLTWLSGALAAHRTCLDGLEETGFSSSRLLPGQNLTDLLGQALASYRRSSGRVLKGQLFYNMSFILF